MIHINIRRLYRMKVSKIQYDWFKNSNCKIVGIIESVMSGEPVMSVIAIWWFSKLHIRNNVGILQNNIFGDTSHLLNFTCVFTNRKKRLSHTFIYTNKEKN